ncbi:MAG: hypothetical protein HY860_05700 [Chlamydiales bacterium]|nr:hypothetical protein [Chlamydiales bacterium]
MMKWLAIALFIVPVFVFAASMRLINDSPFKLQVVILGADGTNLATVQLQPQETYQWYQASDAFSTQNYQVLTPYTVIWYCQEGTEYGIYSNVQQAATISASGCPDGNKICKVKKKQQGQTPQNP